MIVIMTVLIVTTFKRGAIEGCSPGKDEMWASGCIEDCRNRASTTTGFNQCKSRCLKEAERGTGYQTEKYEEAESLVEDFVNNTQRLITHHEENVTSSK